jgi:hypothetical protein
MIMEIDKDEMIFLMIMEIDKPDFPHDHGDR